MPRAALDLYVQILGEKVSGNAVTIVPRRARFEDLARFRQRDDDGRSKVMDELTAEAQRLGLDC